MSCSVTTDPALAARVIREGGLVALPTETVYGLGADATNPRAVARIFAAKERPFFDPLIVHLASVSQASSIITAMSPLERELAARFWPGPLTLVLPKRDCIPDLVTSGLATVGVRVPRHPLTTKVIELAGCPIAAPSANRFGRLSPTLPEHVLEQLGNVIDLVLDGGPCAVGVESTIVRVDADTATVLRPGGTSLEALSSVAPFVAVPASANHETQVARPQVAPGMLPQHYAPVTPIEVYSQLPKVPPASKTGLLTLRSIPATGYATVEVLSPEGDLITAATRFFAALHRLDAAGLDRIHALKFPDEGLGRALNDRLKRASAKSM